MYSWKRFLSKVPLVTVLLAVILVTVSCGTAAPQGVPADQPETAQVVETVPTSEPEAAYAPQEAEVQPGKVTIMTGSLGTERFDYVFAASSGLDYARVLHGFVLSSDVSDGR